MSLNIKIFTGIHIIIDIAFNGVYGYFYSFFVNDQVINNIKLPYVTSFLFGTILGNQMGAKWHYIKLAAKQM